jgi:hypothetical protein
MFSTRRKFRARDPEEFGGEALAGDEVFGWQHDDACSQISWFERPQGSPLEYENAQKRILEVFGQWKAPANFKIGFFVICVGEWGGHMLAAMNR